MLIVIDIHYLNVLEIMNRNEQQMYKDISSLTKALERLVNKGIYNRNILKNEYSRIINRFAY